jgi:hypothetical protein
MCSGTWFLELGSDICSEPGITKVTSFCTFHLWVNIAGLLWFFPWPEMWTFYIHAEGLTHSKKGFIFLSHLHVGHPLFTKHFSHGSCLIIDSKSVMIVSLYCEFTCFITFCFRLLLDSKKSMQGGTEIILSTRAVIRIPLRYFIIIIIIDMHIWLLFPGLLKSFVYSFFQYSEQWWSRNILIEFAVPMKLVWVIKTNLNESCSRVQEGKHLSDIFMVWKKEALICITFPVCFRTCL